MTVSGYCNSAPEAPSSITINETTIELDGTEVIWNVDRLTIGLGNITVDSNGDYTRLTLTYDPISMDALQLISNSGTQRRGVDYTIIGRTIILTTPATAADEYLARYMTATTVSDTDTDMGVGSVRGYDYGSSTANVPAGWLAMDGVTSYSRATYVALYNYASTHSMVLSSTATTFVLRSLTTALYDGVTLVSIPAIIKW